jgi:hypothetical protein
MEVDELGDGQLAVTPARVGMELAKERAERSPHLCHPRASVATVG